MVSAKKKKATKKKPRGEGNQKKAASREEEQLKTTADEKLRANSVRITNSLLDKLMQGDVACGKFLIELADERNDGEDKAEIDPPRSIAQELASEPEWQGEPDEDETETGVDQVEPKNS